MDNCTKRILHNNEESFSSEEINNLIDYQTPIEELFSRKDISEISKFIAHQYIYNNFNLDFNEIGDSKTNITLKEFITKELKNRINILREYNDDYTDSVADSLEDSLEYNDEWFEYISSYFNSLKLNYTEEIINELEETGREDLIRKPSFERSSKEGISSNVKLRLSLLTNNDIVDDIFQEPVFIPLQETLATLQKELTNDTSITLEGNTEDLFLTYLSKIKKLSNRKPYLKDLVRMLEHPSLPESVKTEFFQAFSLSKNNYLTSSISNEGDFTHSVLNVSNVNSKRNIILNNWKASFVTNFIKNNKLDSKKVQRIVDNLNKNRDSIVKLSKNYKNKYQLKSIINILKNNLKKSGVIISDTELDYFLNNKLNTNVSDKVYLNNVNKLNNIFKNLLQDIIDDKVKIFKNDTILNPFKNQSLFTSLAEASAFYSINGNDDSVRSDGKNKWVYSYPSYLSNKINSWKKDISLLENLYRTSTYNSSSKYMEYLLGYDQIFTTEQDRLKEAKKRIDNIELGVFNSLQNVDDNELGVSNVNMSINDAKSDIVNKILSYKKGAKSYVNTPTPADKSTQYQLHIGYNVDFIPTLDQDRNINIPDYILDIFYGYYKSEYNRIAEVFNEIETLPEEDLIVHYHLGRENGKKSQLFPSINNTDTMILFDNDGKPVLEELDVVKNEIKNIIQSILSDKILNTHKQLLKSGVLKIKNNNFANNAVDNTIFSEYSKSTEIPTLAIASNFYVNGLISNVEYSKMFSGDTAFYKNMVDYKKRIPATYTDGLQLRLEQGDSPTYNIAVIDGVEISSPYLDELSKYLPKNILEYYKNINSTDAQAWITPDHWKFLVSRTIGWSDVYNSAYNKMIKGGEFTAKELKKVAQPLKGVYFDMNGKVPTYLKYSQAVLVPNLIKGSQIENVYNKMVEQGVDELITIDGVKVGSFNTTKIHNDDGSVSDDINFNVKSINSTGWKLQQNLPTKTFKETQIGSQIQKNILEGLAFNLDETFDLEGKEYSGLEIYKEINKTIGDLSDLGMSNIINSFGIDENYKINNPERFYNAMIQELKERGGDTNLIKALEAGITPYGIAQNQQKLMNIFFSIMNKKLVKIKTNGGSFIQLSNFGIDRATAESQSVKWIGEPKPLAPYQLVDGKVKPAQILISGSFIAKYIPDYKKYSGKELAKLIDPKILKNVIGYRIPNQGLSSNDALEIVGILPEETGDTIVAYTEIPTKTGSDFDIDKMYIMMPSFKLEYNTPTYNKAKNYIKNILELNREDLINELDFEGYSFDFLNNKKTEDLITLYTEDILLNPQSNSTVKSDFENELKNIDGLRYIDSTGDSKQAKQNKLIELYKSVLLHPNNLEALMTPIDFEYVKNDIINLHPAKDSTDLDDFSVLEDIDLKYEFLAGKAGLGQVINGLVDHIRGLFTNTYIEDVNIGWGNSNELNETVLDKQYSESLNKEKFKISHTLSAFTNAYVDIAKDPYVTRGNFVTQTTNTATLMIRAGVHPYIVNAFIGQPILKEYVEFVVNKESKIVDNTSNIKEQFKLKKVTDLLPNEKIKVNDEIFSYKDIFNSLITRFDENQLIKINYDSVSSLFNSIQSGLALLDNNQFIKLEKAINDAFYQVNNYKEYDIPSMELKTLRDQIKGSTPSLNIQLSVLDKFFELQELSKSLRDVVTASKVDVDGAGKNITSLIISENRIREALDSNIKGYEEKLIDVKTNEPTLLGNYKNNVINKLNNIVKANPKYFLIANQNVVDTFNIISQDVKQSLLTDNKLGDKLENEFFTYVMSDFNALKVNDKENFNKSLVKRIANLKSTDIENFLIQELEINSSDPNYSFIGINNSAKSNDYSEKLTEAWWDLFSENETLANDLVKYSFMTSGFKPNLSSFYQYIPYKWFLANNINNFVINKGNSIKDIDTNFIDQFYRNNFEDSQLVPNVFKNEVKLNRSGFVYNSERTPKLYVNYKNNLYKLVGYDNNRQAVYIKNKPLGYNSKYGKLIGYDASIDYTSIIPNNVVYGLELNQKQEEIELNVNLQDTQEDNFKCSQ